MRYFLCVAIVLTATAFGDSAIAADTAPQAAPAGSAGALVYSVWAFRADGGKWVKDEQHSWTTTDPAAALAYTRKIDAVRGWTATNNVPAPTAIATAAANIAARRFFGRRLPGGVFFGGGPVDAAGNGLLNIHIGGMSVSVPYLTVPNAGAADDSSDDDSSQFYDNWPNNGDTSQIDQMNATQDMINNQIQNDNLQNMLNEQNFENTENMINNQQNEVNTQNAVNEQNEINAQMGP